MIDPRLLFLDANVLAAPVTRSLLLMGADRSGLRVTWSQHAEDEANRHLGRRKLSVTALRQRINRELGPTGSDQQRFVATESSDRQILADAAAAGAGFIITADVDDFDESDLTTSRIAAVSPDLFMSIRYPRSAYARTVEQIVAGMADPSRTPAEMHSLIARQHPRLFDQHADVFDAEPAATVHNQPREEFRGARCVLCGHILPSPGMLLLGLGPDCRTKM